MLPSASDRLWTSHSAIVRPQRVTAMCLPSLTPRKITRPGDSHRTLPLAASTARSVVSKPVVSTSGPAGHTRSVWPASGSCNSHERAPVCSSRPCSALSALVTARLPSASSSCSPAGTVHAIPWRLR
jgi:hypothetical protein